MESKDKAKRLTRRDFLRLAGTAAGAAALASCARPTPEIVEVTKEVPVEKKVVETVIVEKAKEEVNFAAASYWLNRQTAMYQFAHQYAEEFPDKPRINLIKYDFEFPKAIMEAKAGRSSIDCYLGSGSFEYTRLIDSDVITPLDDIFPQDIKDNLVDIAIADMQHEGHIWLLPCNLSGISIDYRKSMLEEVGYPDGPPEYWDDFVGCLETVQNTLKSPDGTPIYGLTWDAVGAWRLWESVCLSLLGYDGYYSEDWEELVNWDHPGLVVALEWVKGLIPYCPPEIYTPGIAFQNLFGAGKAAIMWTDSARGKEVAQKTFGLADLGMTAPPRPREPIEGDEKNSLGNSGAVGAWFMKYGTHWRDAFDFLVWCWRQERFHETMETEGAWAVCTKQIAEWDWVTDVQKKTQEIINLGSPYNRSPYYLLHITSIWPPILMAYLKGEIATAKEALQKGKDELAKAVAIEKEA